MKNNHRAAGALLLCAALILPGTVSAPAAVQTETPGASGESSKTPGAPKSSPETLSSTPGAPDSLPEEEIQEMDFQLQAVFPDWKGYTDDTLAMNSMCSFFGYHGQGTLYVSCAEEVESFRMYVNGHAVDTQALTAGTGTSNAAASDTAEAGSLTPDAAASDSADEDAGTADAAASDFAAEGSAKASAFFAVDISSLTVDGTNTLQISNIRPSGLSEAVEVRIPYPIVLPGNPEEEGISTQSLSLISDLIETDIENGFTSAQLSVIRNGRLVYENAWGLTNSYLPDGTPCADSAPVTTETLYDLASVTKMFSVNYALQKLLTDGEVDLDSKITEYLGEEFVTETILLPEEEQKDEKAAGQTPQSVSVSAAGQSAQKQQAADQEPEEERPDLETVKAWKAELTIRDLLRHQGGFPADPKYCAPLLYKEDLEEGETYPENPLFAGNGADEETLQSTIRMICRTPLEYEPGTQTVYSDVDYIILGLVIEKITGEELDTWLKHTFYEPMGLAHITYNPLQNGFSPEDCAATELNGNTRDKLLDFDGYRTETIQGEVHDEKAYYSMAGVSGHAGLFSNATDLAKLAEVMLCGGYGTSRFFSTNVMDMFTSPKKEDAANWGLGWWRQGDAQRVWYFGTQAGSDTIGHQGWTGTLVMVDPGRNLVIVYLTNKINSPVTDNLTNANKFNGNWYTASTLGFVPQILSIGMDSSEDISCQLLDLTADMALESLKLIPEDVSLDSDHPAVRNAFSKKQLFEKTAAAYETESTKEYVQELKEELEKAFEIE